MFSAIVVGEKRVGLFTIRCYDGFGLAILVEDSQPTYDKRK